MREAGDVRSFGGFGACAILSAQACCIELGGVWKAGDVRELRGFATCVILPAHASCIELRRIQAVTGSMEQNRRRSAEQARALSVGALHSV
jgi:hypothetical protein